MTVTPTITFFPVDNGDMTFIETANGKKILIDTNIRHAADDPDDDTPDVAKALRDRLSRDEKGRLYVDAFLLGHPDQDHCGGLVNHFHLGPPDTWNAKDDKIVIREQWSSPMVFRRASRKDGQPLCEDAKAFQREAVRRVEYYRKYKTAGDGNRILILGEDENGKTDDLTSILVRLDTTYNRINGTADPSIVLRLLGPLPAGDEAEEKVLSKNDSSTILQVKMSAGSNAAACQYLTGGDAGVAIWERVWHRHKSRPDWLAYDLLLSPHHCSWHALSSDSWRDLREKAQVNPSARKALGQARRGANVIASSKPVTDDDTDPPCIRAKREYESILMPVSGTFRCTGEYPSNDQPSPMEFEITTDGPRLRAARANARIAVGSGVVGSQPLRHGK